MSAAKLKRLLASVECANLYEFLKLDPSATPEQLCDAARKEFDRIQNKGLRGGQWDARKELTGLCKAIFRDSRTKKEYDRAQQEAAARAKPDDRAASTREFDKETEPQPSNRQPWQYEQPTPRPQHRERPAARMSGTAVLVLAGIGLVTVSFLLRSLDSWLDRLASSLGGMESSEQSPPGPTQGRPPQLRGTSTDVAEPTRVDPPPPPPPPEPIAEPVRVADVPRDVAEPTRVDPPPPPPPPEPIAEPAWVADVPRDVAEPTRVDPPPPPPPPEPIAGPVPEPIAEPVRVADVPRQAWRVDPVYPYLQRMRRTEGFVILQVTVDREGDVSDVSVLRSDVDAFAEPAVSAVRQWRYEPTVIDGRPVSVVFTFTLFFSP